MNIFSWNFFCITSIEYSCPMRLIKITTFFVIWYIGFNKKRAYHYWRAKMIAHVVNVISRRFKITPLFSSEPRDNSPIFLVPSTFRRDISGFRYPFTGSITLSFQRLYAIFRFRPNVYSVTFLLSFSKKPRDFSPMFMV